MSDDAVIGRAAVLEQVDRFLTRLVPGDAPAALVFEGEVGIGKSTVWAEAVRRARQSGALVLEAQPSQAEARYSFSTLADLLEPVGEAVLARLPDPQRRAIEASLLRAAPPPGGIDERGVGAAVLSIIRSLASDHQVLVAVDDVQWLDTPSAKALEFALRRLGVSAVGVLFARRTGSGESRSIIDALAPERRERIAVRPLSVAALHQLFKQRLGHSFARPTLVRIAEATGGNPFYSLEVAYELEGEPAAGGALPIPAGLSGLIEARLGRLPGVTRGALLAVACLHNPTRELVDTNALAPAEAADIVRIERVRVRFTHPLYASAVYGLANDGERRLMHQRLSQTVAELEEQARHAALGAVRPDRATAARLDAAATEAAARGAGAAAVELATLAVDLTPSGDRQLHLERRLKLAELAYTTGARAHAATILHEAFGDAPCGEARAAVGWRLGYLVMVGGDWPGGVRLVEDALAEARDPRTLGRIHVLLADCYRLDLPRVTGHAEAALELLDADVDPGSYARALQLLAEARLLSGLGADHGLIERSLPLAERGEVWEEGSLAAAWARGFDDFETARSRLQALIRRYEERGQEMNVAGTLAHIATIEAWTGHVRLAETLAREALELAEQAESPTDMCLARFALGLVLVQTGRLDDARATAELTLGAFPGAAAAILSAQARAILGAVALARKDAHEAVAAYAAADAAIAAIGWQEPFHFRYHADQIEALLLAGHAAEAERLLVRLEDSAHRIPRPWITAVSARCRALLLAHADDLAGAIAAGRRAAAAHEMLDMPLEHARTLLVLGQIERRLKQKRRARDLLEQALQLFEQVDAPIWAERARSELQRIGGRASADELSATEMQIARLAATGLTNRSIAEQAFVSRKTVEANLARAYRKLGIRSRAQLAMALAARHDTDA